MKIQANNLKELTRKDGGIFKVTSLEESYEFCKKIALGHYENFPVGSIFIPKKDRKHFFAVYAFSRISDDISDEIPIEEKKLKISMLNEFSELINDNTINGNPVFKALQNTMNEKEIPDTPLKKLIKAFIMDSDFKHPESFDEVLNYCKYSANPVGELVLRIFDNYNSGTADLSDKICTGLQLANFWQDISVDAKKSRVYIPNDILKKYDLSKDNILNKKINDNFSICLKEIYDYTDNFFKLGTGIVDILNNFRLKLEIALIIQGGKRIMDKVREEGINIISARPVLKKYDYFGMLIKSVMRL